MQADRGFPNRAKYVATPRTSVQSSSLVGSIRNPSPKKLDLEGFDYKTLYWEKKPVPPINPVALEPPFKNVRILAQRGMFTIHGDDTRPLEEICPDCVRKIEIPKATFPEMNDFFEFADLNEFKLFPDLHGIAPFLKKITGLE